MLEVITQTLTMASIWYEVLLMRRLLLLPNSRILSLNFHFLRCTDVTLDMVQWGAHGHCFKIRNHLEAMAKFP